jgi:hypothetical protein
MPRVIQITSRKMAIFTYFVLYCFILIPPEKEIEDAGYPFSDTHLE